MIVKEAGGGYGVVSVEDALFPPLSVSQSISEEPQRTTDASAASPSFRPIMNRLIVGIILTTLSLDCNGRPCCFVPSNTPFSSGSGIGEMSDYVPLLLPTTTSLSNNAFRGDKHRALRIRQSSSCCMNKVRKFFEYQFPNNNLDDQTKNEKQSSKQRGVWRRMRDKISTTLNGDGKQDEGSKDNSNSVRNVQNKNDLGKKTEIGYKPTALDAIRLRLAMAMSGLSNINLFQFGKEEWVVACPKTRVGPGQIVPCSVNGIDIIIFASRDGQRLDAFANACPHLGSPFDLATIERKPPVKKDKGKMTMDDSTVDGCVDCIVCPVHQTAFEIQSGQVSGDWCPYPPILGGVM